MKTFTYEDLIDWATRLPAWMQDALRRLLEQGELNNADFDELASLAKAPYEGTSPDACTPLTAPTSPSSETRSEPVSLTAVTDIARANALAEGPISFSPEGLSIVYGDNGCGKSSLARILKKACRSLVPGGPILPSIDEGRDLGPAQATVEFVSGASAGSVTWIDGARVSGPLDSVNVFDAACARAQVSRENAFSYKPTILRVFETMAAACTQVTAKLQSEHAALGGLAPEISQLELSEDSKAGKFVTALSSTSDRDVLATLCNMSAEETQRLEELRQVLRDSPFERSRSVEARVKRIDALAVTLSNAANLVSDESLEIRALERSEMSQALAAAEAARVAFSESSILPGGGTEVWRALWDSARRYSEEQAYPGHVFPVTDDQPRCVLCQQVLAPDGMTRLKSFEEYITSDTQQAADATYATYTRGRATLDALCLPNSRAILRDCELVGASEASAIRLFVIRAKLRRRHVLRQAGGAPPNLPTPPDLSHVTGALRTAVSSLLEAATDEGRNAFESERRELADRQSISPLKEALTREINRLQADRIIEQAISDCGTHGLTRKEGEVANAILAGNLSSKFATNLTRLNFTSTGVQVALGKGSLGSHPYAVKLMEDPDVSPELVLSEGEATCVALAGFFAELETSGNVSGVVLDDPVSSLDHNYRSAVAKLIAEESIRRQIVVLTHDVAFLWLLRKHAKDAGVSVHESTLERGHKRHGSQKMGPPFVAMAVSKRIAWLRNEIAQAKSCLKNEGREAYERRAEFIYLRLRKTWERAVEERLLNNVVERFGVEVQTKRLKPLCDIVEADIQHVTEQMSRCSGFAHDQPGALHAAIPDPEVLEKDLAELKTWVDGLRVRGRKG